VAFLHSKEGLQTLNAHMIIALLLHNVKKGGWGVKNGWMLEDGEVCFMDGQKMQARN